MRRRKGEREYYENDLNQSLCRLNGDIYILIGKVLFNCTDYALRNIGTWMVSDIGQKGCPLNMIL